MMHAHRLRVLRATAVGAASLAAMLLGLSRAGHAATEEECNNNTSALCRTVERCEGGFEANGSCKWIYTIRRYYWKY